MTLDEFLELAQEYTRLGWAVQEQLHSSVAEWEAGSQEPICSAENNPNAFSMYETRRFLEKLARFDADVEGAADFHDAIHSELEQPSLDRAPGPLI